MVDNYGTHQTPEVQTSATPSSFCASLYSAQFPLAQPGGAVVWDLTPKAVRRGAFASVPDLVQAIEALLAAWNENPRPFVWTAKLEDILQKIERVRAKLESIHPGSTQP